MFPHVSYRFPINMAVTGAYLLKKAIVLLSWGGDPGGGGEGGHLAHLEMTEPLKNPTDNFGVHSFVIFIKKYLACVSRATRFLVVHGLSNTLLKNELLTQPQGKP